MIAQARSFSAVLFRRIATRARKDAGAETSQDLFYSLASPQRDAIRSKLLEALTSEQEASVRNKVGDAVAEIARQYAAEGKKTEGARDWQRNIGLISMIDEQWPELLGALFHCSQSAEPGQRETAFRIFATTPDIIEKQHEQAVLGAFTKGFKDSDTTVWRIGQKP